MKLENLFAIKHDTIARPGIKIYDADIGHASIIGPGLDTDTQSIMFTIVYSMTDQDFRTPIYMFSSHCPKNDTNL